MKNVTLAAVLVAVIALCVPAAFAQAQTIMAKDRVDLSVTPFLFVNPCGSAPESVLINKGFSQSVFHVVTDANGSVHISFKPIISGEGYGTVTGRHYKVQNVAPYNMMGTGTGFSYSAVGMLRLSSGADTYMVRFNYVVSYKDGDVNVRVDNFTTVCR